MKPHVSVDVHVGMLMKWESGPAGRTQMCPDIRVHLWPFGDDCPIYGVRGASLWDWFRGTLLKGRELRKAGFSLPWGRLLREGWRHEGRADWDTMDMNSLAHVIPANLTSLSLIWGLLRITASLMPALWNGKVCGSLDSWEVRPL